MHASPLSLPKFGLLHSSHFSSRPVIISMLLHNEMKTNLNHTRSLNHNLSYLWFLKSNRCQIHFCLQFPAQPDFDQFWLVFIDLGVFPDQTSCHFSIQPIKLASPVFKTMILSLTPCFAAMKIKRMKENFSYIFGFMEFIFAYAAQFFFFFFFFFIGYFMFKQSTDHNTYFSNIALPIYIPLQKCYIQSSPTSVEIF